MEATMMDRHRGLDLDALVDVLNNQDAAKFDVVVPGSKAEMVDGVFRLDYADYLTEDGVFRGAVELTPTDMMVSGMADRLGIPRAYLRRMLDGSPGDRVLGDRNINHWLRGTDRNWFVRAFLSGYPDGPGKPGTGVGRAFLSDRFGAFDHLDALSAVLDGIRSTGVDVQVGKSDLSPSTMRLVIDAPAIAAEAPRFLRGYVSPFDRNRRGADLPVIHAGLAITNSETGHGAFAITPRIVVLVCRNGMTRTVDAFRKNHLGARLEAGAVTWSDETHRANVELIRSQTVDAVTSFLNPDYVSKVADELEAAAGVEVENPQAVIEHVAKVHAFTDTERDAIFAHFIRGGDTTAGGVMQAVTATAQVLDDPDRAAEFEDAAFPVLATARNAASITTAG